MCYNIIMVKTNAGNRPGRVVAKKDIAAGPKNKSPKTDKAPTQKQAKTGYSELPQVEIKEEQPKAIKKQSRRAMPAVLRMLVAILFLIVFAGIFTWYILLRQNMGEVEPTLNFIQEKPVLAGYSYVIILLLMCVLAAATWRPFLTIGISFAVFSILMYINTQKFEYRDAPLLPEDFLLVDQTGTIMQFVDPWSVTRLVAGVVLVIVGAGILECGMRRVFGRSAAGKKWWERHSVIPRVAWTLVALTGLLMFAHPVLHYNDKNEDVDAEWIDGLSFEYWDPKSDYSNDGFIIAFLYNIGRFQEPEPEDYGEKVITEIMKEYARDKTGAEHGYASLNQVADNVIVVLNESFIDPEILDDTYRHTGGDVVPNLHEIFEKYPSGYMYSSGYGGGTANIEFEVLTSLSNYWAQTTPYVTSLTKMNNIPSIINSATSNGFKGTAIHTFDGTMYKRSTVYARMGIETFLDEDSMSHVERENGGSYISDHEAYQEALDILQDNKDKNMIMIATMQNHTPYYAAGYERFNYKLMNQVDDTYSFESYLETVHHSDQYLGEFVTELDKLEERTVMVWFGDHAPALLDRYTNSGNSELVDLAHLTPYFIYANFDLEELYSEKEVEEMNAKAGFEIDADGVDLPVVTPNCLMSMVYRILDVKMPPLVALSNKVCAEAPVLTPSYSKNNEIKDSKVLQDYHLVNYDILSGKRYWLGL